MSFVSMTGDADGVTYRIDGRSARFLYPVPPKPCMIMRGSEISDKFEEPKALVAEAIFAFRRFEEAFATFNQTGPFELLQQFDTDENCWKFRFLTKKNFPVQLEAIAKTVVHNLRAALDLMIATLVRCSGANLSKQAGFPISKSRQSFEKEFKAKLENVPDRIIQLIRRLKPYDGGNQALWALAQLDNLGKHNELPPVAVAEVSVAVRTAMPGVFLSPEGEICLLGGPPGAIPFGHDRGFLIPEGTSPTRIETNDVELYRFDAALRECVDGVSADAVVTIGPYALTRNFPVSDIFAYLIHLVQRILKAVGRIWSPN
ncbi:hypothetical protein ELH97_06265 [Rhizobium leguminosarum]|uniref:hypothetical protein n=1 Tax=Rhizobium leguminosarum TaxID=384 RepID=UPI00102F7297|nr:hypothetical protein [Rhizobium leguminosarum]TAX91552.1 hypothetical protein ELH97_06265 [Rhizobium leguminosarum]